MPQPDPSRPPEASMREVDQAIRRAEDAARNVKDLIQVHRGLNYLYAFFLFVSVALGALSVGWEIKNKFFGRTHTFEFSGILAPERTRDEFSADLTKRLSERGYEVESVRVTWENSLHQFDGYVTLVHVPDRISSSEVRGVLQQAGESLKDKQLPVEK